MNYFSEDLKNQKLKFPDAQKPEPLFYELSDEEDMVFNKTIDQITRKFKYVRYTPLLPKYYNGDIDHPTQLSQENMGKFMKILLVKRLESSFYAFKKSIDRFLHSYEVFIKEYEKGNVYVSKKFANKIFELLENDDDEAVQRMIDEGKAEKYPTKDFKDDFIKDLKNDLNILKEVRALWQEVKRDPKLLKFLNDLSKNKILKENKLIVFTESKETAEYLAKNINNKFPDTALLFSGGSGEATRDKVIENFDARARHPKDDHRILVSTEVLSEGVNLHRSNTVINYDIPWNPTRMMQRVGRINRVDTKFSEIYTFNFFPTQQSNDQIKLREAAEAKINAFLTLLGGDAALLTEGEPIGSHELFNRLISKQIITGEDEKEESELKYLQIIKNIRDKEPDLFEKIKHLPKKARTAKFNDEHKESLLNYFRRGKLDKFFMIKDNEKPLELDFLAAAKLMESDVDEKRQKLPEKFYDLLDKNKEAFIFATTEEMAEAHFKGKGGRDSATNILKILKVTLKNTRQLTDEQELYLRKVVKQLEEGGLPKQTTKEVLKALDGLKQDLMNPLKVLATLQTHISSRLLGGHYIEYSPVVFGKREVILSMYFNGE
jgi:superfamily II DNA/RNA helicase